MPWVGGQSTMGRGVDIPLIGGSIYNWLGGRYTMGRKLDIACVGSSIYHG